MTYVKPDPASAYAYPPFAGDKTLACRTADPELFFSRQKDPGNAAREAAAKRLCRGCPRRRECLEWALDTGQTVGIWGAATPAERARMLTKRPAEPPPDRCGTRSGYIAHRTAGEDACHRCLAANAAYSRRVYVSLRGLR